MAVRLLLTAAEALAVTALDDLEHSTVKPAVSQAQKSTSTLLALPPELRETIYRHVLAGRHWAVPERKAWRQNTVCRALGDPGGLYTSFSEGIAILRVNKQIRREALPVAFQETAIRAVDLDGAVALLLAIGRIGRDNITSFQLGWDSYADNQIKWSLPEIPENVHLKLPSLHVPMCIDLLKQCPRLTHLTLVFPDFIMTDKPLSEFQSDPGIKLCCSLRNIKRLDIVEEIAEETLEDLPAAIWLKAEMLGG